MTMSNGFNRATGEVAHEQIWERLATPADRLAGKRSQRMIMAVNPNGMIEVPAQLMAEVLSELGFVRVDDR